MQKSTFLLVLMFGTLVSNGQNISVTFTGTGTATQIDSVKATNLTTDESITLPGNETLVLGAYTGIPTITGSMNPGMIYPNPFSGKATFIAIVQHPQTVDLKIRNLVGQVLAHSRAAVQPGENEFYLSVAAEGIYLVNLTTDEGTASYKIICTESSTPENSIQFLGSFSNNHNNQNNHNNHNNSSVTGLKTSQTSYTLGYTEGDIILYRCMSGIYTTIVTDSPVSSKNYLVEFIPCTDPDGRNYSIVKIGSQIWTAENLAFLPAVYPSLGESVTSLSYWVYDYEGTSITEAKSTDNFTEYGVLYSWEAAMNGNSVNLEDSIGVQGVCPNGWHLPSDEEWTALTDYLGESAAAKMKETGTNHWGSPNEGATTAAGFIALPGGGRSRYGLFQGLGEFTYFWTASAYGPSFVWVRKLDFANDVTRNYIFPNAGFSVRCLLGQGTPGLASLTSTEITAITDTTASSGGVITSNWGAGVTMRGVCWNTNENPTVNDSKTADGSGAGKFSSILAGLRPGTQYYVRAYATNSAGTAYGEQKEFKTTGVGDETTFEYDGRIYNFKTIGTQTWMTENLAYLPAVNPSSDGSVASPYCYVYGFEGRSVDSAKATANYADYGVLYNWPAALIVCPLGWHLPSDAEWTTLTTYLGGDEVAGGKMKKTGTTYWRSPNIGATNESGFTALAGGYRSWEAYFYGLGQTTAFWSSKVYDSFVAYSWYLTFDNRAIVPGRLAARPSGYSVRCVRD
ncbi:MAG: T9SS type A sorting domain-containing protein [Bacteroidia bacterium]|nr:T9SS type A sorting domain-containing protein [Bacteroidia bacterium]